MGELPHRFVPTTRKFVSPVRIVAQTGHRGEIAVLAFSPCHRYLAAADRDCVVKIWCLETLDVIGSYRIGFVAEKLVWEAAFTLACSTGERVYRIAFEHESDGVVSDSAAPPSMGYIPLLDAPSFGVEGDRITVTRGESTFVHTLADVCQAAMDVCERYVMAWSPKLAEIYDTSSDKTLVSINLEADDAWRHIYQAKYGASILALSEKQILQFDPIREKPVCMANFTARITADTFDLSGLLALGDANGNIAVYSALEKSIIFKTPRFARSFVHLLPSPEKNGLIAFREESVTAFMGASQEILSSSPLPSGFRAACAGACYTEVFVACEDQIVYRLNLNTNGIVRVCSSKHAIDMLAAAGDNLVLHSPDGALSFFDGAVERALSLQCSTPVHALAINETATLAAIAEAEKLHVWDLRKNVLVRTYDVSGLETLAFGKDKTADAVLVFLSDHTILSGGPSAAALSELNRFEDPVLEHARIISVAPAAKSFVFVLCEIDHGQYVIVRVGLNSGKSAVVLRVCVAGTQIWGAAANDNSVLLREDASCLRIIHGLTSYSVQDWSRSEPLALF